MDDFHKRLGRYLLAAYEAHRLGLKGIDRTLQRMPEDIGEFWTELAAHVVRDRVAARDAIFSESSHPQRTDATNPQAGDVREDGSTYESLHEFFRCCNEHIFEAAKKQEVTFLARRFSSKGNHTIIAANISVDDDLSSELCEEIRAALNAFLHRKGFQLKGFRH